MQTDFLFFYFITVRLIVWELETQLTKRIGRKKSVTECCWPKTTTSRLRNPPQNCCPNYSLIIVLCATWTLDNWTFTVCQTTYWGFNIVFRLHSIQCIGTNYVSPIFCGDHPPHESNLKHSIFILPGHRPDPWLENAMPSLLWTQLASLNLNSTYHM